MGVRKVTGGGGIQLAVEEAGNPDGRPVLFIHGFSQSRLCWTRQLHSDLSDHLRLVAFDLRGHGESEKPRDAYGDSRLWADDVRGVITALGLERPVLVGWSYGGSVIADYLEAHGEGDLGGVNLVGAVSKLGTDEALAVIGPEFLALAGGFVSDDAEQSVAALDTFMRLCFEAEQSPADHYLFLGFNAAVPPHVRAGMFARSLTHDDLLAGLTLPVLLTHGDRDRIVLPAATDEHEGLVPRARVSRYAGIGHAPFWEDSQRFNAELRAFVEST